MTVRLAVLALTPTVGLFAAAPFLAAADPPLALSPPMLASPARTGAEPLPPPPSSAQRVGRRSVQDWRDAIDQHWGPGLPADVELGIFHNFVDYIEPRFPCFNNLDVPWDSLRAANEAEIAKGVSRGRFAAILNSMCFALKDLHTRAGDVTVNVRDQVAPGAPILVTGFVGSDRGYVGAAMTPLSDESLLVYRAAPNQPLGLVPGDIVLGYDGVPWRDLLAELLEAQLPTCGIGPASSPGSFRHWLLEAGGWNWHLFQTMDVLKHDTGEVVHLSTSLMAEGSAPVPWTDSLPVPGVAEPDWSTWRPWVTWGKIAGTSIGYIRVTGWADDAGLLFAHAVNDLRTDTRGLILDFRLNAGGSMFLSNEGLAKLFQGDVWTIGFAVRADRDNRLLMVPDPVNGPPEAYVIHGDPNSSYDRPIAVLTGPYAVSAGDQVALRMKFHPRARFFGKSTCTAFSGPVIPAPSLGHPDFFFAASFVDAYLVSDPNRYLSHRELDIDEPVWLTPDRVARGQDDVVLAAMSWIYSSTDSGLITDFSAQEVTDGSNSVEIRWDVASTEWLDGFRIHRTDSSSHVRVFPGEDDVFHTSVRTYDDAVEPGAEYEYRVAAVRPNGREVLSDPVSVRASGTILGSRQLVASPNPFRDDVRIEYQVPLLTRGPIRLDIHDAAGRLVRRYLSGPRTSGRGVVVWDGLDSGGRAVSSGVYWLRLNARNGVQTRRVVRIR